MEHREANGTFYAVGVGPGDPSLLTLQAVKVLNSCPVIAAPRTKSGKMTALDIIRQVIELDGKEVIPLDFTMSRDISEQKNNHTEITEQITVRLAEGQDVAMINLGDVSLYATAGYLLEPIRCAGYSVRCVPGVTSYSAVAAALGQSLAERDTPVHIIPLLDENWNEVLELRGTKVFMKPGKRLPSLVAHLRETGRSEKAWLVSNCGMEGERIISPLNDCSDKDNYFTIVIVKE